MRFGHFTECNKKILPFKNYTENVAEGLFPVLFLFFQKALYYVTPNGLQLSFNIF